MSADNGIYVLESAGPEYRVAHAMAIENINYNPDLPDDMGPPFFNMDWVNRLFGKCEVFTDINEAWKLAFKMEDEIMESDFPILEYGVSTIKMPHPFPCNQIEFYEIPPGSIFIFQGYSYLKLARETNIEFSLPNKKQISGKPLFFCINVVGTKDGVLGFINGDRQCELKE
ncbi:hypothetical protein LCGC14_0143150 [marine sediment metagenome]|uniref:Uncharacterized protein n=1 Tax=marine sediment metagenome TaxID=412755 RepID=A0A0F9Y2X2_9ZZZZ